MWVEMKVFSRYEYYVAPDESQPVKKGWLLY